MYPLLDLLRTNLPGFPAVAHGENVITRCPFHKGGGEHNPSFSVNVRTGLSNCFTCGRGWNLNQLLDALGIDKDAAREVLAASPRRPIRGKPLPAFLPESILGAYRTPPRMLLEKGFRREILQQMEVGEDRKLDRIVFPVRDKCGRLVALLGRVFVEGRSRYKVYKQELDEAIPGYGKQEIRHHDHIWNFFRVQKNTRAIVVAEGFKATLRLLDYGYEDTVALMGVRLTWEQEHLLLSAGRPVILFLDENEAGREATNKVGARLQRALDVYVARYPHAEMQPDDLTEDEAYRAITGATPYRRWRKKEHEHSKGLDPGQERLQERNIQIEELGPQR